MNNAKLSYAAKTKTVCKTNPGAKIQDIRKKLAEECHKTKHGIIVHAGTNNLVSEEANKAAEEMEKLVLHAKKKAENVAVSSVVARYDNRVPQSRVTDFNNLVKKLCTKHNISFIDNSDIEQSMLNGSNLHLNYKGDKVLGKNLCAYLRTLRPQITCHRSANLRFFARAGGHRTARRTGRHVSRI